MPDLILCPNLDCFELASISERFVLDSSDGPVEHVRASCAAGHHFMCSTDRLRGAA